MSNKYDVIIIGAGVGGLVCGCYLAKSGLRVLILEQQDKPGGCCTSFSRGEYIFDVGVHYLGSCRSNGGIIYKVLNDLGLWDKLTIIDQDPHDRIITPQEDIYIGKNIEQTKDTLASCFPEEKNSIDKFFALVVDQNLLQLYSATRGLTFKKLLDKFFKNERLKALLSIPIGNIGLPPSKASSFISVMLYREYVLDGGYYPKGGIQKYPDLLADKLVELGGEVLYRSKVEKILCKNHIVGGVKLENGEIISAPVVVANCDATKIFTQLLDDDSEEKFKTANLEVSASAFVVYLGVKKDLSKLMNKHMCTWYFPTYDIEKCYDVYGRYRLSGESLGLQEVDYLICHFPSLVDPGVAPKNRSSIRIELWVSQTSINSWAIYKERLYQLVLRKLEELIPGVSSLIELVEIATPQTINKWVSSADGAIFGWAATVNQEDRNVFPPKTSVDGLYLTGSWATNGFGQCGVPIVTLSGQKTADLIKRKFKIVNPPISTLS